MGRMTDKEALAKASESLENAAKTLGYLRAAAVLNGMVAAGMVAELAAKMRRDAEDLKSHLAEQVTSNSN